MTLTVNDLILTLNGHEYEKLPQYIEFLQDNLEFEGFLTPKLISYLNVQNQNILKLLTIIVSKAKFNRKLGSPMVREIVNNLPLLYRNINSGNRVLINATWELLIQVVGYQTSITNELTRLFNFSIKGIQPNGPFVRFIAGILRKGGREAKRTILQLKLTQKLLDHEEIRQAFMFLLEDINLRTDITKFFHFGVISKLLKQYNESIHQFLCALCLKPGFGICFKDSLWTDKKLHNHVLSKVVLNLNSTAELQKDFLVSILKCCPELVMHYWKNCSLSFEPRSTVHYMSNMALAHLIIALPVPELEDVPSLTHAISNIMPDPISKLILSKSMQGEADIKLVASSLILASFEKLQRVMARIDLIQNEIKQNPHYRGSESTELVDKWEAFRKDLLEKLELRLPDPQTIIKAAQQFDSAAEQAGEFQVMIFRLLTCYLVYFKDWMQQQNYDFGKLIPAELGNLPQATVSSLLDLLVNVPDFKWWVKPQNGQHLFKSNFGMLFQLYLQSDGIVSMDLENLFVRFLSDTYLFKNNEDSIILLCKVCKRFSMDDEALMHLERTILTGYQLTQNLIEECAEKGWEIVPFPPILLVMIRQIPKSTGVALFIFASFFLESLQALGSLRGVESIRETLQKAVESDCSLVLNSILNWINSILGLQQSETEVTYTKLKKLKASLESNQESSCLFTELLKTSTKVLVSKSELLEITKPAELALIWQLKNIVPKNANPVGEVLPRSFGFLLFLRRQSFAHGEKSEDLGGWALDQILLVLNQDNLSKSARNFYTKFILFWLDSSTCNSNHPSIIEGLQYLALVVSSENSEFLVQHGKIRAISRQARGDTLVEYLKIIVKLGLSAKELVKILWDTLVLDINGCYHELGMVLTMAPTLVECESVCNLVENILGTEFSKSIKLVILNGLQVFVQVTKFRIDAHALERLAMFSIQNDLENVVDLIVTEKIGCSARKQENIFSINVAALISDDVFAKTLQPSSVCIKLALFFVQRRPDFAILFSKWLLEQNDVIDWERILLVLGTISLRKKDWIPSLPKEIKLAIKYICKRYRKQFHHQIDLFVAGNTVNSNIAKLLPIFIASSGSKIEKLLLTLLDNLDKNGAGNTSFLKILLTDNYFDGEFKLKVITECLNCLAHSIDLDLLHCMNSHFEKYSNLIQKIESDNIDKVTKSLLEADLSNEEVLLLLFNLCENRERIDCVRIMNKCVGSEDFDGIMAGKKAIGLCPIPIFSDSKCVLLKLFLVLMKRDPNNCCQLQVLKSVISNYHGSFHPADRLSLQIMRFYEQEKSEPISPYLGTWGKSEDSGSLSGEALNAIDSVWMANSLHWFPFDCDISKDCFKNAMPFASEIQPIYDPSYFLMLLISLLEEGSSDPKQMIESNIVGMCVLALSSNSVTTRKVGHYAILKFYEFMEKSELKEKTQIMVLLDYFRNGLIPKKESEFPSVPTLITSFVVQGLMNLIKPESHFYPLINRFCLQRDFFDVEDVPMFYELMNSSKDQHRKERTWLLRLLYHGINSPEDYRIFRRRHTFDILMGYFNTPGTYTLDRKLIFQIVFKATAIPSTISSMITSSGLLLFLRQLSTVCTLNATSEITLALPKLILRVLKGFLESPCEWDGKLTRPQWLQQFWEIAQTLLFRMLSMSYTLSAWKSTFIHAVFKLLNFLCEIDAKDTNFVLQETTISKLIDFVSELKISETAVVEVELDDELDVDGLFKLENNIYSKDVFIKMTLSLVTKSHILVEDNHLQWALIESSRLNDTSLLIWIQKLTEQPQTMEKIDQNLKISLINYLIHIIKDTKHSENNKMAQISAISIILEYLGKIKKRKRDEDYDLKTKLTIEKERLLSNNVSETFNDFEGRYLIDFAIAN